MANDEENANLKDEAAAPDANKDSEEQSRKSGQTSKTGSSDDVEMQKKVWGYQNRGCTDIIFLIAYFAHWGVFFSIVMALSDNANPSKLYRPRDFRGDFCGIENKWGPPIGDFNRDQTNYPSMVFMMNISGTVEDIAKSLVCSDSMVSHVEQSNALTTDQMDEYRCGCCLTPCGICGEAGSASGTVAGVQSQMAGFTGAADAAQVFLTSGPSAGAFQKIWEQVEKYFVQVCVSDCNVLSSVPTNPRTYVYSPAGDVKWKPAWDELTKQGGLLNSVVSSFTFSALPESMCQEDPKYCVGFPGIEFTDLQEGYCAFSFGEDITAALGDSVSSAAAVDPTAANSQDESSDDGFSIVGEVMSGILQSFDSLAVCAAASFVLGIGFLVLLRFLAGIIVWGSILFLWALLISSGVIALVRCRQCANTTLSSTASAVQTQYAQNSLEYNATLETDYQQDDGSDYRGFQYLTRTGRLCQDWDAFVPHNHTFTVSNYPNAGLESNYCRNPTGAQFIWCLTNETSTRWAYCNPLGTGILSGECPNGYAVADENYRTAYMWVGIVFLCLAVVYFFGICCLCKTIKLAIIVIKAASQFIIETPYIMIVPSLQILLGVLWCGCWSLLAAVQITAINPDMLPSDTGYASYAWAGGVDGDAGNCTDTWPKGGTYREDLHVDCTNSGLCWRCYPPRYKFDSGFAVLFFSFLWNNALLIATGQLIFAGTVFYWFFTHDSHRLIGSRLRPAIYNTFRFHFGSACFGSLIIATVQFARAVLFYIEKQVELQNPGAGNPRLQALIKLVFRVLKCVLWCFERLLKFICKQAYIQIAIEGKNFCGGAFAAFYNLLNNAATFGVIYPLAYIIQLLGMVFITFVSAVAAYNIIYAMEPNINIIGPLMLATCVGWMIGTLIMQAFSFTIETMIQCNIRAQDNKWISAEYVPNLFDAIIEKKNDKAEGDEKAKRTTETE
jgi:hypothetical protein